MESNRTQIPRFLGAGIFLVALLLYFALTTSVFLILSIQSLPRLVQQYPVLLEVTRSFSAVAADRLDTAEQAQLRDRLELLAEQQALPGEREQLRGASLIGLHLFLVPLVTGGGALILVVPYRRFLRFRRKNSEPPDRLERFCRRTVRQTPLYYAGLVVLPHLILGLVISFRALSGAPFLEAARGQLSRFLMVALTAAVLQALFVYSWQRYRVQMHYLHHFFSREELQQANTVLRMRGLSTRLWLTNTMTTFLPIVIIVTYVVWSMAPLRDPLSLSTGELSVLLGEYAAILAVVDGELGFLTGVLEWAAGTIGGLWYVNAIDTALMFAGIASGAVIAVIYVILLIRWTTGSIIGPVKDVLSGMRESAEGQFSHRAVVRDRDEIGELTLGFNRMNDQLDDYFTRINRLNQAYYQFVPEQFLRILGKDRIEEVKLGDQVQREMTLLFSDIRRFTAITEQMTPQESFTFINQYLGAMEPAITESGGFIDKFIGDAIMALFDSDGSGALAAAIAMQRRLREHNKGAGEQIQTGIGIHTGMLMLGLVGGAGRMDGTVISDAVNLASRLEGLTKHLGCSIIASAETVARLPEGHSFLIRPLGQVSVSGRGDPVSINEVLDPLLPDDQWKRDHLDEFAAALKLYQSGEFAAAQERFYELHAAQPGDLPSRYFSARSAFMMSAPPVTWNGIESFAQK
jgi:class 3 adenylate cyclase/HAMP domain-containing protein